MNILHFSLGIPPYRSGGSTRYSFDLMQYQAQSPENRVALLSPGPQRFLGRSRLSRRPDFGGVQALEIDSPSPVPLLDGVRDPKRILNPTSAALLDELARFLDEFRPDVAHLHTLMGLPQGLLEQLRARGTKIFFTTHDYYGICPKTVLVDHSGTPCSGPSRDKCEICNRSAPGWHRTFLHSRRELHRFKGFLRKWVRTRPPADLRRGTSPSVADPARAVAYQNLLDLHERQLALVDRFHFVSSVCEAAYRRRFPSIRGICLPPIHSGIRDRRTPRAIRPGPIRLGFVGDSTPFKGYPALRQILTELSGQGFSDWELHVHGPGHEHDAPSDNIHIHGPYGASDLEVVYRGMDLLLVPSLWMETFSLVALEAISFGTPCLVSSTVGAKDVVGSIDPLLVADGTDGFKSRLQQILSDPGILRGLLDSTVNAAPPLDHAEHCRRIELMYLS